MNTAFYSYAQTEAGVRKGDTSTVTKIGISTDGKAPEIKAGAFVFVVMSKMENGNWKQYYSIKSPYDGEYVQFKITDKVKADTYGIFVTVSSSLIGDDESDGIMFPSSGYLKFKVEGSNDGSDMSTEFELDEFRQRLEAIEDDLGNSIVIGGDDE